MSRVAYQPKLLNRGAISETKRAKGADSLPNATDNAQLPSSVMGEGSRRGGFLVQDALWCQVEELAEPSHRRCGVLLLETFIVAALPPQRRVGKEEATIVA